MSVDHCKSDIAIYFKAQNTNQLRAGIKNDCYGKAYWLQANGDLELIDRTELQSNTNDPEFLKCFKVPFLFETRQEIVFKIFHAQSSDLDEGNHPIVGEIKFSLVNLFQAKSHGKLSVPLLKDGQKTTGTIEIIGEIISEQNRRDLFEFQISAKLAINPNILFNPDVFFTIHKMTTEFADEILVYQSPVQPSTISPDWKPDTVLLTDICSGDLLCPIKLQLFQVRGKGNYQLLGEVYTNVENMLAPPHEPRHLEMKLKSQSSTVPVIGKFFVTSKITPKPTEFQYLQEVVIHHVIAIDYSFSNGNPKEENSLHRLHPDKPKDYNNYELAIMSIENVLMPYDDDGRVPMLGLGARVLQADGAYSGVQHCFYVEENEVHGVDGMLKAYQNSFSKIKLSGPTMFHKVIEHVGELARKYSAEDPDHLHYTILSILTDGELQNKEKTIRSIVDQADAPLSIVIVGVKEEEKNNLIYEDMRELDGDDVRLSYRTEEGNVVTAVRDIVQFTEFKKGMPATALAEKVLQEIPDQILSHFEMVGKYPKAFLESIGAITIEV